MTPDGRRADAQCSAKIEEVTCQKCKELKDFIDTTSERHRKESQEQIDSFERIGQPLGHY